MPPSTQAPKYIDPRNKILDPRKRELEPAKGDVSGCTGIVKAVDADQRTVTGMVSTNNTDRFEEIIEPEAFRPWLDKFMKNPVFLAGHQHVGFDAADPTVLGNWTDLQITADGLQGTAQFLPEGDPLADAYWRRYAAGAMRAFSVGFIVHQWEMREFEMGEGVKKKIRVFTEVELLEISAVSVPANRESLVNAASAINRRDADISTDELQQAFNELLQNDQFKHAIANACQDAIAEQLHNHLADPDPDGPVGRLIETVAESVARHGVPGIAGSGPPPKRDAGGDGKQQRRKSGWQ